MSQSESNYPGSFFVIEGSDGSGKGTQYELLVKRLVSEGYSVATFDFPQYDEESSYFVKEYLNGNYGNADEVGPYTGSLFYALDRYQASKKIRLALADGNVVIANRFTGSNMAHQGTKFLNAEERRGYFIWLDNLEYEMLGIPRPNKSIVLRVPAEIAQEMIDKKGKRNYTDNQRDIHEADLSHLKKAVEVYDDLCQLFPKDFQQIDCLRNNEIMSIDSIADILWANIEPLLPPKHASFPENVAPKAVSVNKYITKTDSGIEISPEGKAYLESIVTDTEGDVYSFNNNVSNSTIAAAMARLSRRGDDMRLTILDEFAHASDKDEKLLKRVITAYGDDSVQQLTGIHLVVENASNLLTKKLEWGRLASYLEQSTRYIYFDKKTREGKYRYFTPSNFDDSTKEQYNKAMDVIFDAYSDMVHKLTAYVRENSSVPHDERDIAWQGATRAQACDAARSVLPVATTSTVGIYASGQAIENLIMNLQSDELLEARETGKKILEQARKIIPAFLERADKPDRGGATIAYKANTKQAVKKLSDEYLAENYAQITEPVQLTNIWPRNELDLVPNMLYEHSNLPLNTIKEQVDKWSYDKKIAVFNAYMGDRLNRRHRPGRALENAHYSWDLVCDYGIFRDLQRHRMVDDLNWQVLTPRYGYDVPDLVEQAGLTEQFEACFDLSLELHSMLQSRGYTLEAQYATLLGHKMRWKVTYNARSAFHFHELRASPQGHPGYRSLLNQMHDKLMEVHPLLASHMIFINKDEDPELTRLAAERYTQFKLNSLGD